MLSGRRFVVTGRTHLSARVQRALVGQGAEVTAVGDSDPDPERALEAAGLATASGLLLLGDDDLESLRAAAAAHALAPHVPVVLRTFQPELVDEVGPSLNIRRAFSVAALAAPSFVAAALGEQVLQTLRLGDEDVPLCVVAVHPGSPLVALSLDEVKEACSCAVVAVAGTDGRWEPAAGAGFRTLAVGDRALVGGRRPDVLDLARRNDDARLPVGVRSGGRAAPRRHPTGARTSRTMRALARPTLLRVSAVLFALAVLANFVVTRAGGDGSALDAFVAAVGVSVGNLPPPTDRTLVKAFNVVAIAAGVVLPWILLSYITAIVLAERLELRMAKRAGRMRDHVVLIGLGRVGYRVAQILVELGIPAVAIEEEPDSRFFEAIASDLPVLRGDGRLPENLRRCGIERARTVIACTDDDLANLAACREARRINPGIRTVLRAFDETVSHRLAMAFAIDAVLSSATVASDAFVGAAVDELAMRPIELGALSLVAYRFTPEADVAAPTLDEWRARGVRLVAWRRNGVVEPPSAASGRAIAAGDEAIVVGPAEVVRAFAGALD